MYNFTRADLISYMTDCLGYSEYELAAENTTSPSSRLNDRQIKECAEFNEVAEVQS